MSLKRLWTCFSFLVILCSTAGICQESSDSSGENAKIKEKTTIQNNYDQWKGLGFGMAVGMAIPLGKAKIIDNFEIVDQYLRITKETTNIGQILLESHYFFPLRRPIEGKYSEEFKKLSEAHIKDMSSAEKKKKYFDAVEQLEEIRNTRTIGVGPFVAILPGTDKVLKAIGFGVMLGLRRGTTSNSFNVGIGYINYSDMQILADGVNDGEIIPANTKPVKTSNTGGMIILFSFSF